MRRKCFIKGRQHKQYEGRVDKCGHTHANTHTHVTLKALCFKMSICLCHIKKPVFPCFKRTGRIQGVCLRVFACVCLCLPACAHLHACTLKHACFHKSTYHSQYYMHESADVIVLMIIMMLFVYLQRWKKVDGG